MLFEQKITLLEFESEFIKFLHLIKNNSLILHLKKRKEKKPFSISSQNLENDNISTMTIYNILDVDTHKSDNIKH